MGLGISILNIYVCFNYKNKKTKKKKRKKLQFTLYIEWAGLDSIHLLSRPTIRMLFMFSVEFNENYRLAVYRSCEKRG